MGDLRGAEPATDEPAEEAEATEAMARRWPRPVRILVRLVAVLVVLGVLLAVAERVGHSVAEQTVADQIAAELAAVGVESTPPEVTIGGSWFLRQLVSGEYEEVTVNLREAATAEVALTQLELTAIGVSAELGTLVSREGPVDADRLDGTAMIGYEAAAELTDLPGLELSDGGDGLLGIRLPRRVLGERVMLVGTAELEVRTRPGNTVRLHVQELEVEEDRLLPFAEELVDQYAEEYAQDLSLVLRVPPLPFDLTIDTVTVEPGGLAITVSAVDVPLAR